MELQTFDKELLRLAGMKETGALTITCYTGLKGGASRERVEERARWHRRRLTAPQRREFDDAFRLIADYLNGELPENAKSVALFARAGPRPFFAALPFRVPMTESFIVSGAPSLYGLVEARDTYYRYVAALATKQWVGVFEVNLGSVTRHISSRLPTLRPRRGNGSTKEDRDNRRRERISQYFRDQVRAIEQTMIEGGYAHLVLAGRPQAVAHLRSLLPKPLADRIAGVAYDSGARRISDAIAATVRCFVSYEERESQALLARLADEIGAGGLAVAGPGACLEALRAYQGDVLLLARRRNFDPFWDCSACGRIERDPPRARVCPGCAKAQMRPINAREEMVRLALRSGCRIEVVDNNETLHHLGGAGCLLRFMRRDVRSRAV